MDTAHQGGGAPSGDKVLDIYLKKPSNKMCTLSNEVISMISVFLPPRSLANFVQTCQTIKPPAERILYIRNAREGGSSAFIYAVILGCKSPHMSQLADEIFQKALSYEADVNAQYSDQHGYITALSIASGYGDLRWTQRLLDNGADMSAASKYPWNEVKYRGFQDRLDKFPAPLKENILQHQLWLPLFLPMVIGNLPLVGLLTRRGAPSELTMSTDLRWRPYSLTAHHICAAECGWTFGSIFLERYPLTINIRTTSTGHTPLWVAVLTKNEKMFDALIQMKADLDAPSTPLQLTPLHLAVRECHSHTSREKRRQLCRFIFRLVEGGANVNLTSNPIHGYTPLMLVMEAAELDWHVSYREMKQVLELLIKHGANINRLTNQGETAVSLLAKRIASHGKAGSPSLLRLLEDLVRYHGADLNQSNMHGHSLLGHLFRKWGCPTENVPTRLMAKAIELEAVLLDDEADRFFLEWMKNKSFHKMYNLDRHMDHISQESLDAAYIETFAREDLGGIDHLLKYYGGPTHPEPLVWSVFDDPDSYNRAMADRALRLPFDGSWTDATKGGFLHCIVRLFRDGEDKPLYGESQAIKDAEVFIDRGASLLLEDGDGWTALQRLRLCSRPSNKLRLYLLDRKDYECGVY